MIYVLFACVGKLSRSLIKGNKSLCFVGNSLISDLNKTRQGYARKRILKPAGYSFQGCQL